MNNCQNNNTRSRLLRKIQQHSFALVEANLYLDVYPNCKRALAYFQTQKNLYKKYLAEYEENYGPLTASASSACDAWKWIQGPWPWESEAN